VLENARSVMKALGEHGELQVAAQALGEIEAQHEVAKAAHAAALTGRIAVQTKQRELQVLAADVQNELVKLRRVIRIVLGSSHIEYQRLRLRLARISPEVPDESGPESEPGAPPSERDSQLSSSA
jgi:hypothetical protein